MVLGEAQILGQMKNAVRAAEDAGALGSTLNQLFQRSFAVAKEVRSSTEIGAHSISMAAAAVRLAGQLFEDLSQIKVLPKAPAVSAARTASFIWPRICASPSTIESSPLATRKAWRATWPSSRV